MNFLRLKALTSAEIEREPFSVLALALEYLPGRQQLLHSWVTRPCQPPAGT